MCCCSRASKIFLIEEEQTRSTHLLSVEVQLTTQAESPLLKPTDQNTTEPEHVFEEQNTIKNGSEACRLHRQLSSRVYWVRDRLKAWVMDRIPQAYKMNSVNTTVIYFDRYQCDVKKSKVRYTSSREPHLRATGRHLP